MHRFNALTFTYVRVVCAQLPPRLLALPPHALPPPPPPPAPPPPWAWTHWRWRLPQYVPTNYVYSRLQASDMHTGRRTWTNLEPGTSGNWELGNSRHGHGVSGYGSGSAHRGVPRHQRQRHQRIDSAWAFWLFGWVTRCRRHSRCAGATTPTPTPSATPTKTRVGVRFWVRARVRCAFYVNLLTTILAFVCALLCVAGWIPGSWLKPDH